MRKDQTIFYLRRFGCNLIESTGESRADGQVHGVAAPDAHPEARGDVRPLPGLAEAHALSGRLREDGGRRQGVRKRPRETSGLEGTVQTIFLKYLVPEIFNKVRT